MRALALAVIACCLVAASGCGSGDEATEAEREVAERLVRDVDRWVNTGDFASYWDVLHPAHQRLVSRESFIECWDRSVLGISTSFKVLSVKRVEFNRPGVPERKGLAVRFRIAGEFEDGGRYGETLVRLVVRANGRWRYLLGEDYVADLRARRCPLDRTIAVVPSQPPS